MYHQKKLDIDSSYDFPFNYKEGLLDTLLQDQDKKKNDILHDYLTQQKHDVDQHYKQKRQFVIKNRKQELLQQKQSMSYGQPKHNQDFKSTVHMQEQFDVQKPILLFPNDIVLNTFDNTKRFLKEFECAKDAQLQKRKDLRANNYHHYKGHPFNFIKVDPDYFGEFQIYKPGTTTTTSTKQMDLFQKYNPIYHHSKTFFAPVNPNAKMFQSPQVSRFNINIPLAAIHEVKYWSNQSTKPATMKASMLNQLQKVQAFKPTLTHPDYFQLDYLQTSKVPLQPLQGKRRQRKSGKDTQGFLQRGVSPNRSTPRVTPGRGNTPNMISSTGNSPT